MIIDTIKEAIKNKTMVKYHKQSIDMQTANVLLKVYETLSPRNQPRFIQMAEGDLPKLINFCWGQVA